MIMNLKKILFIVLLFGTRVPLSAQEFYAYNNMNNKDEVKKIKVRAENRKMFENKYTWEFLSAIPSIDENIIKKSGKHDLGQRVACLKNLMENHYITKEDVIPGDPMMRTIVLKPNVYYTVRKIEKYLKREVKNGDIRLEEASSQMEHILEVALSVIDNKEESFEIALNKNKKNMENLITLFQQVKLQHIYK